MAGIYILVVAIILCSPGSRSLENVALNKTTRSFYGISSHLAVDGVISDNYYRECTREYRWLMVDLGNNYVVMNVTAYIAERYDHYNIEIGVGLNNTLSRHHICARRYQTSPSPSMIVNALELTCQTPMVGRWVSFSTNLYPVFLCELQVFAYKYSACGGHSFGENCSVNCHCQGLCNDITGKCNGECSPGYLGADCQRECDSQRYGKNCAQICHCARGADCQKQTGICPPGGCTENYGGQTCGIELPKLGGKDQNVTTQDGSTSVKVNFRQFMKGRWQLADEGTGPVGQYTFEAQERGSSQWVTMVTVKHDHAKVFRHITMADLKPNTRYRIRVVPWYHKENVTLRGRPGTDIDVITNCADPEKPLILSPGYKLTKGGSRITLSINFQRLAKNGHNCNMYKKVIGFYKKLYDTRWRTKQVDSPEATSIQVELPTEEFGDVILVAVNVINNVNRHTLSDVMATGPPPEEKETTKRINDTTTQHQALAAGQASTVCPAVGISLLCLSILLCMAAAGYFFFQRYSKKVCLKKQKNQNQSGTKASNPVYGEEYEIVTVASAKGVNPSATDGSPPADTEYELVEPSRKKNARSNHYDNLDPKQITVSLPADYESLQHR